MSTETTPAPSLPPAPAPPAPAPPAPAPAAAAPKPAAPPPPPDPKILAWRDELQPILGSEAVWELSGQLPVFRVPASGLHPACRKLKEAGFDYCLFVTAADFPKENRFELIYVFTKYTGGREIGLVADVDRAQPVIETVSDLWATAEWHEREVFDLFGITFKNHADLRRILLDDSWAGHPLRKDYADPLHEMIKRPY